MKDPAQQTIEALGNRSDSTVTRVTFAFAMGGALMDIAAHLISSIFAKTASFPMLWGIWIPLCFLVIPPIHYLCRQIVTLQRRVAALEAASSPP